MLPITSAFLLTTTGRSSSKTFGRSPSARKSRLSAPPACMTCCPTRPSPGPRTAVVRADAADLVAPAGAPHSRCQCQATHSACLLLNSARRILYVSFLALHAGIGVSLFSLHENKWRSRHRTAPSKSKMKTRNNDNMLVDLFRLGIVWNVVVDSSPAERRQPL